MKIAILTPTFFEFSGIDRVAESQAIEYSGKGHDISVFTLSSKIKPKGYKVIDIGMPKSIFMQRIYRLFFFLDRRKINRYSGMLRGFDKVISHMYPMNLIAKKAKERYGVEYVFYNHGVGSPHLFKNIIEKIYMYIFIFFNNLSLKGVDKAYSISNFMRSELLRESKVESKVTYNKIDRKKFNKNVKGNRIIKKHTLIGKKVLLFVGRLSPHKEIGILLKAFEIICRSRKDVKLIIIGKPTFERYYNNLRKKAGKDVIFINSVSDKELPEYYASCDVYVTASLWEGFNLPAAEAQECGKAVVAFNCCSHPEIVKKGVLVKRKDVKRFAQGVLKLLK